MKQLEICNIDWTINSDVFKLNGKEAIYQRKYLYHFIV